MDERGRRTGLGSGLIGNVAELGAGAQEQLEAARPSPRMSSPFSSPALSRSSCRQPAGSK